MTEPKTKLKTSALTCGELRKPARLLKTYCRFNYTPSSKLRSQLVVLRRIEDESRLIPCSSQAGYQREAFAALS